VIGWLAERYSAWKLGHERSNSTSTLPQLSENITLPSTGQSAIQTVDVLYILYLRKITSHVNGPFSGTARVSRYQKGKTNLDFAGARDSEWQWHQLGHMQVCNSLQADNHASFHHSSVLQAACPSCRPTNSVKALKASQITVML